MTRPNELGAAEAIARLASGALTAEELIRACLERAEERRSVKAWTWLDPEQAEWLKAKKNLSETVRALITEAMNMENLAKSVKRGATRKAGGAKKSKR